MNSLDRAKQFLAAKAAKLAMVALPLAALTVAVPTNAGATSLGAITQVGFTLNPSISCTVTAIGACTTSVSSPGGDPNGNEVTLYTNGAVAGNDVGTVEITASGGGGGTISGGEKIPVSYDFLLTNPGATSDTASGYLAFFLTPSGGGSGALYFVNFNHIAVGNEYQGTGTINAPFTFKLGSYVEDLYLNSDSGQQLILSSPSGTGIELNAVAPTPEPASLLLAGTGIIGALALRRRKKS